MRGEQRQRQAEKSTGIDRNSTNRDAQERDGVGHIQQRHVEVLVLLPDLPARFARVVVRERLKEQAGSQRQWAEKLTRRGRPARFSGARAGEGIAEQERTSASPRSMASIEGLELPMVVKVKQLAEM